MIDYFPLGVSTTSDGFCNRIQETEHLKRNIKLAKPTLIMSPRRYGKTSLALHTLNQLKAIYTHIDFYKELSTEDIGRAIINGVGQLLGRIESKPKLLLRLAGEFFADMHIKVVLNKLDLSIEIGDRNKKDSAHNIQEALIRLHKLVSKKKKQVIFFIDEFQKIAEITENYAIEAAIRHAAQVAKNVVYILSGSNRHLIQEMFFDKNRPFYKLCDYIHLDRIEKQHYYEYIQKAAVKHWRKKISINTIKAILNFTECHPYYVNLLCSKIWLGKYPSENEVELCWQTCASETNHRLKKKLNY